MYEVKIEAYNQAKKKVKVVLLVDQPTFGGAEECAIKHVVGNRGLTDVTIKSITRSKLCVGDFAPEKSQFVVTVSYETIDGKPFKEQTLFSADSIDEAFAFETNGQIIKVTTSKIEEVI